MLRKSIVENLDFLGEIINKEIKVFGNYYIVDGLCFTNIKRLVGYAGKSFEVPDIIKSNTILRKMSRAYDNEPEPEYTNFEWSSLRSRYFTDDNVHHDDQGFIIASRRFPITSSWGNIQVEKFSKLIPLFTIDGLETGMLILRRTVWPKVFSPTLDYLRPINFASHKPDAFLLGKITSKTSLRRKYNVFTMEMIPSLFTMCKAGMIIQITAHSSTTKNLAVAMSQDKELLSVPYLSINKKSSIDFISENILKFTNKELGLAIDNVVEACYALGEKIPAPVANILADRSKMIVRISEETRQFVFHLIESFFTVVKTSYTAVSEKYGDKNYVYGGAKDIRTARAIVKKITNIDKVSDVLAKVQKRDLISLVHEYLNKDFPTDNTKNESYLFGGISMIMDYEHDRIIFANVDDKVLHKSEKWLIDAKMKRGAFLAKNRPKVLRSVFLTPDSEINALRASYILAVSAMLDIECSIKIYGQGRYEYRAGLLFFNSPSFNPFHLVVKSPRVLKLKMNDVGYFTEDEAKEFGDIKRKIIFVNKEDDTDIHFRGREASPSDKTSVYRLRGRQPDKRYIVNFYKTLELIVKNFVSKEHAANYLSDPIKMKRFSKSFPA